MILILTAVRPRPGEDPEGEPAGGGCNLAGPLGSGRRLGTGAEQLLPRAARAPRGLHAPPGPRAPTPRTAAAQAPPWPLGAREHPSPRAPPPPARPRAPQPHVPATSTDSQMMLDTPISAACSSQLSPATEGLACPRAAGEPATRGDQQRRGQPERRR